MKVPVVIKEVRKVPARLSAIHHRNPIQIENMRLSSFVAFIFDIDGTLVDSNELHIDSWDRAFRRFGKQFPREQLRAQIGKGSDQYLPEFLTPEEIKRFGKELDEY
ncbi:MAG TPA: HAD hydrolase-like protein, partial [Candidatus Udaeobacter sp.]